MTIAGDPIRHNASHGTGRTEERFRRRQVSCLAQPHIHQMAVTVDGPIQVTPPAIEFDIGLVDVPALTNDASAPLAQLLSNQRSKPRLPFAH